MSDILDLAKELGTDVVAEVKTVLGNDYETLTEDQKESIKRTANTYMALQLRLKVAKAKGATGEVQDLEEKVQAVESTILDWKVWGELEADTAFWKGVEKVASTFGSFLGGAASTFLGLG